MLELSKTALKVLRSGKYERAMKSKMNMIYWQNISA
jgi:hypothetical protein